MSARARVGMRRAERRGAVSVELLVSIVPVLVVALGAVQVALVGAARLAVGHAAARAARSAAVVLDDLPSRYGGAPRGDLGLASTPGRPGSLPPFVDAPSRAPTVAEVARLAAARPTRLDVIRRAATVPLSAFAPEPGELSRLLGGEAERSVQRALGEAPWARVASGVAVYGAAAVAVSVGAPAPVGPRATMDLVDVRVSFLFHCGVPIVARWLCRAGRELLVDGRVPDALAAVPAPAWTRAILSGSARYLVLSEEASFPRQRAAYPEAPADDG